MKTENKKDKVKDVDLANLKVLKYPDPRLREECTPVTRFDESLTMLAARMFELMFESRGVGLAAPQVGVSVRMFVASPSFEPTDCRIYVNPQILATAGTQDAEEGCLSFPGIYCKLKRAATATIKAQNLKGEWFEETGMELTARIFQHETDHLDNMLLVDRMGTVAKLSNRRALKTLEETFEKGK